MRRRDDDESTTPNEASAIADPPTNLERPRGARVDSDAQTTKRPATLSGRASDRYRLGDEIGRGGMGEIIAATDDQIGREVAVKRMKERNPSEQSMRRFFREASIQGRLDHPAIVPVYELGVDDDGRPYFTMKRLAGTTLADLIDDDHPRQRLLRAFVDICLAIEFAHARGVIHRDLKPQNIVLGDFGEVYVLDWGAAKMIAEPDAATDRDPAYDSEDDKVTIDGTVIGTRGFMPPEQILGMPDLDGRVDVYALGCMLFEILAGEPLARRRGPEIDELGSRPSLRAPGRDIPPELDALCVRATVHDRDRRLATPRELGDAIQRYLDGDRDLAQRNALAREHLIAARAAFARGDGEDERRIAMREAGRALALDPKLAGAAELVTRLMLEPPRVRPPEVERLIDADNLETLRRQARTGAFGYLGFLAFLPILAAGDSAQLGYAALLVALIALNAWLLVAEWSYRNLRLRTVRIAIANVLLIGAVGRLASPFLFAPAIATLATTVLVFSPTYGRPRSVLLLVAGFASALLVLHLVEARGWISPSTEMIPNGIALTPPILQISDAGKQVLLVLTTIALIAAGGGIAFANRRAERTVRDRLHMQAWQLRQLVS